MFFDRVPSTLKRGHYSTVDPPPYAKELRLKREDMPVKAQRTDPRYARSQFQKAKKY